VEVVEPTAQADDECPDQGGDRADGCEDGERERLEPRGFRSIDG